MLNADTIKIMAMFESFTHAKLKDCFTFDDTLTFVVNEGEMGKALGKGASNVHRMQGSLNRKIKILEFNPEIQLFIRNMGYPARIQDIQQEGMIITLIPEDLRSRGILIGRNAQNLREMEKIAKRYFDIEEIKVK